jgi:hypothetical protein
VSAMGTSSVRHDDDSMTAAHTHTHAHATERAHEHVSIPLPAAHSAAGRGAVSYSTARQRVPLHHNTYTYTRTDTRETDGQCQNHRSAGAQGPARRTEHGARTQSVDVGRDDNGRFDSASPKAENAHAIRRIARRKGVCTNAERDARLEHHRGGTCTADTHAHNTHTAHGTQRGSESRVRDSGRTCTAGTQ